LALETWINDGLMAIFFCYWIRDKKDEIILRIVDPEATACYWEPLEA
jgi:Na+/H+ antiporter NhaA